MRNPGSKEAIDSGCRCPVMDNNYGQGIMYGDEPVFWISGKCPLHGDRAYQEEEDVSEV